MAIFCSRPSSCSTKFSFFSPAIGEPCASVTVTKTLTSLTSTLSVVSGCAWEEGCRFCCAPATAAVRTKSNAMADFLIRVGIIPLPRSVQVPCIPRGKPESTEISEKCRRVARRKPAQLDAPPDEGLPRLGNLRAEFLEETAPHRPRRRHLQNVLSSRSAPCV